MTKYRGFFVSFPLTGHCPGGDEVDPGVGVIDELLGLQLLLLGLAVVALARLSGLGPGWRVLEPVECLRVALWTTARADLRPKD
jgi:hypothetical protein